MNGKFLIRLLAYNPHLKNNATLYFKRYYISIAID